MAGFRVGIGVLCVTILVSCLTPSGAGSAAVSLSAQPVGIATVVTMIPGADPVREATMIKNSGANAVRIPINWNLIQPWIKSHFDWSVQDATVNAAHNQGLLILLVLVGPAPTWALKLGADPMANGNPPANANDFGDFARAVALRYARFVSIYEIWNEPNMSQYLIPPTPAEYLPLLKAAYTAIRGIGIREPIITGGTSSARGETRDIDFITGLYNIGAKPYFDGISVHPYTFPYPLTGDPRYGDGGGAAVLPMTRNLMVARGDAAKKVWVTEYGQPTGNTSVSVSEARQTQILADAVTISRSLDWIGGFFIFNTRDLAPNSPVPDANFGLYRFDYSPKPAVAAIRGALAD